MSLIPWLGANKAQHIYKSVWTTLTDKVHKYIMEEDGNKHDEYTVIHSAALSGVHLGPCVYMSLALIQIYIWYIVYSIWDDGFNIK